MSDESGEQQPRSLRELGRELGLPEPEVAILNDALTHLEDGWPLSPDALRRALRVALGHGDCVPREAGQDRYNDALDCLHDMTTRFQTERARAERAEAERDALRADLRSVAAHARAVLARRGIGLERP